MLDWKALFKAAKDGSDMALARLVSAIEAGDSAVLSAIGRELAADHYTKRAVRIGITGAAGVGKSTLVSALTHVWPGTNRVGAIAVDPSSEVSGGALLGDRLRIYERGQSGAAGNRLYLRSMGVRGSQGALSRYVGAATSLLEGVGFDPIFVETAGAGQSDTAVTAWVDCLVLILSPEGGDVIQMMKAGLMEWADIYVVNKADREGSTQFASQLRGIVAGQKGRMDSNGMDRIHLVQATDPRSTQMADLIDTLQGWTAVGKQRKDLWVRVIEQLLDARISQEIRSRLALSEAWKKAVASCAAGELEPSEAVADLLAQGDYSLLAGGAKNFHNSVGG
ncbi:MAG: hypothetical protein ACYDHP_10960 [Ferrimicrobium sp.]